MKTAFADGETGEVITNEEGDIVWRGEADVAKVRKCLSYKDCFVTKKLEEESGKFWAANPVKKKAGIHSRKQGLDSAKYGGYEKVMAAYSLIFTCDIISNKKTVKKKELMGVPIRYANESEQVIFEYVKNRIIELFQKKASDKIENLKIIPRKIYKNQLIEVNGGLYTISSTMPGKVLMEWHNAKQLVLPKEYTALINKISNLKKDEEDIETYELMDDFYSFYIQKMEIYPLYTNVSKKLLEATTKFKNKNFEQKKAIVLELITMTKANPVYPNLKDLGLSTFLGKLNGRTIGDSKIIFIDQSVTGMYAKRWKVTEEGICELANGNRN
ncbi:MAG: Cas9 endonuclease PAM-interacting domain-containing protein [Culicoidibacterales bacterium]